MWKCVLGYGNTHFWLCKNTGTMNRSPTPAECSQPISWVSVSVSWNVHTQFRGRMQPIHGTFVAIFLFVRHIIIIYVTHYRNSSATHFVNIQCIILNRAQLVYFVLVTHSENKNPLFALQKPYFCTPKTPFLHAKKGVFVFQKYGFWSAKRGFLFSECVTISK